MVDAQDIAHLSLCVPSVPVAPRHVHSAGLQGDGIKGPVHYLGDRPGSIFVDQISQLLDLLIRPVSRLAFLDSEQLGLSLDRGKGPAESGS